MIRLKPSQIVSGIAASLAVVGVFFPALRGEFLNWDDAIQILDNPQLRALTGTNLWWMWAQPWFGNYHPLTWMSYAANFAWFGPGPFSFHLVDLLLHLANAWLVFALARRLLGQAAAAGAAALFFAIHPLRVESVAWISARGNLLSAAFLLTSVLCFLDSEGRPRRPTRRLYAVAAFALSLFSKAWAVVLPAVFLVLDVYPLKNLPLNPMRWPQSRGLWARRAVFWLLAAAFALLALWAKSGVRSLGVEMAQPLEKLWLGSVAVFFYAVKILLPWGLSPFYEHPVISFGPWLCLAAGLVVVALTAASFFQAKKYPALAAGWWVFMICLAPVAGLSPAGAQWAADRYTYLAGLPFALGFGWLWGMGGRRAAIVRAGLALWLALLGVWSHRYTKAWENSETLWTWALAADGRSPFAHFMLGGALAQQGRLAEAEGLHQEVLAANPRNPRALLGLAEVSEARGDWPGALAYYEKAAGVFAFQAEALEGAGRAAYMAGDPAKAFVWFERAAAIAPHSWSVQCGLGAAALQVGRPDIAESALRKAERLYPASHDVQNNLGLLALGRGDGKAALAAFQQAVKLKPDFYNAHLNLAAAQTMLGDRAGAEQTRGRAAALEN